MTQVIVPNVAPEMVGDLAKIPLETRRAFGLGSQRMLWYARDGDVVVLPGPPNVAFLEYVTSLTGVDPTTLRFVYPPPGDLGSEILSPDRLLDHGFHDDLRAAVGDRHVVSVVALYVDVPITQMVVACHLEHALPGSSFSSQDGVTLANSKTVFRAIATASGLPIAPGSVARLPGATVGCIEAILVDGHPVMVKQQFSAGGIGNEILTRHAAVEPRGTSTVRQLETEEDVRQFVDQRWDWLTGYHGHSFVVERFFERPVTVYAEFVISEDAAHLRGVGEILMEPTTAGEVIPPQSVDGRVAQSLVEAARAICDPYRMLGYRGTLCVDGIVTPGGEIYFTEVNGRQTASSHLHVNIIHHVVGSASREGRVFLEKAARWPVSSLDEALSLLDLHGLSYDPDRKLGVIVTADYVAATGRVTFCVVAESMEQAESVERRVLALSGRTSSR